MIHRENENSWENSWECGSLDKEFLHHISHHITLTRKQKYPTFLKLFLLYIVLSLSCSHTSTKRYIPTQLHTFTMQILYILNTANLVPKINKNDHFTQRKAQFTACLVLEKVIKSCVNDSFPSLKQCTFQSLKKKKKATSVKLLCNPLSCFELYNIAAK